MPEGKKCVHPKRRVWVVSLRAAAAAARTCKKTADLPNPPLETDHEGAGNGQSHVGAPFLQTLGGPPCSVGRDGAGVWLTLWSAALNRFEPLLTDLPTSFYAAPSIGCIRTAADRWQPGRGCWRWLILCRHKWQICLSVESHWFSMQAAVCASAVLYIWCNQRALIAEVDFLQNQMFVQLEQDRLLAVVYVPCTDSGFESSTK